MPAHSSLKASDSHNTAWWFLGTWPQTGHDAIHSFHHNTQHPDSGATGATLHHSQLIHPESDTWRFQGSMPAIQQYKIHPQRDIIHEVTGLNGVGCWRSQNLMADFFTITAPILSLIAGDRWARRQLRNGIQYVPVASKPIKLLSSVHGVAGIKLVIFYSMADISTTDGLILTLFAGDCRARRQLPNGIMYVCVASRLRKSLSSVEGVLGITGKLAIFYSMADYSTTAERILILFAGGCWVRCQLRNGIRFISPQHLSMILQGPA